MMPKIVFMVLEISHKAYHECMQSRLLWMFCEIEKMAAFCIRAVKLATDLAMEYHFRRFSLLSRPKAPYPNIITDVCRTKHTGYRANYNLKTMDLFLIISDVLLNRKVDFDEGTTFHCMQCGDKDSTTAKSLFAVFFRNGACLLCNRTTLIRSA
ncbi:unnamed protein product [Cuscuta campestris]|uniref:Uncharacterized protein n=1 Tax=Cuscuta campestris TaxID=132261 RepID=A0A484NQN1_9ASTE|nr:unnamed protein product [Cuscuta campestris]